MGNRVTPPTTESLLRQRARIWRLIYFTYLLTGLFIATIMFAGYLPFTFQTPLFLGTFIPILAGSFVILVLCLRFSAGMHRLAREHEYRVCPRCCFPSDRGDTEVFQCTECGDTYSTHQAWKYIIRFVWWPWPPKPIERAERRG